MHPDTAPETRPVNLTMRDALDAQAEHWISENGLPQVALVEDAIRRADLAGDPFCENHFRDALLRAAYRRGASRYGNHTEIKEN